MPTFFESLQQIAPTAFQSYSPGQSSLDPSMLSFLSEGGGQFPIYGSGADNGPNSGNPMGYDSLFRFAGANGEKLISNAFYGPGDTSEGGIEQGGGLVGRGPLQSFRIGQDIGYGGGYLGDRHFSRMNDTPYSNYDLSGNLTGTGRYQGVKDEDVGAWGFPAVAAMAFGGGALSSLAEAGAATGAGAGLAAEGGAAASTAGSGLVGLGADAFETIAAENAAQAALAGGTAGGAALTSGGGSYIPGVDSQLYNASAGITGSQAAADAAGAAIPSVTVNGAPQGLMNILSNGGFSMDTIRSILSSSGQVGSGGTAANALRYGNSIAQIISGLESRKKAKQLAEQMKITAPTELPAPGDITSAPGYQAGLEAVQRSMAAQGYQGSGNMMAALSKYGGDFYNQYVTQRQNANRQMLDAAKAQAGPTTGSASSLALLSQGIGTLAGAFL